MVLHFDEQSCERLSRCRYVKFNEDTLSKGGHGNVHGLKKGKKIGEK